MLSAKARIIESALYGLEEENEIIQELEQQDADVIEELAVKYKAVGKEGYDQLADIAFGLSVEMYPKEVEPIAEEESSAIAPTETQISEAPQKEEPTEEDTTDDMVVNPKTGEIVSAEELAKEQEKEKPSNTTTKEVKEMVDDIYYPEEMPTSVSMEDRILEELNERAKTDADLADALKKENKSMEECCKWITAMALKAYGKHTNGSMAWSDIFVFDLASQYYKNDKIVCRKKLQVKTVVVTNPTPSKALQKTLDKVAKDLTKKDNKTNKKGKVKMEVVKTPVVPPSEIKTPSELNNKPNEIKIFSGIKKGTQAYNDAIEKQIQLSLF